MSRDGTPYRGSAWKFPDDQRSPPGRQNLIRKTAASTGKHNEIMNCQNCNNPLPPGAANCPFCGTPVQQLYNPQPYGQPQYNQQQNQYGQQQPYGQQPYGQEPPQNGQ